MTTKTSVVREVQVTRPSFLIDRRLVLKGSAASLLAASVPASAIAKNPPDAVLFTLSDLHAPYARLPSLLATLRKLQHETSAPTALLINGDIFERGNTVCHLSNGVADWAFLAAISREMPVVVNLGNHEAAIFDDLTNFLDRATQTGIQAISNLVDRRTNRLFVPHHHRLILGSIDISLLGLAATNPFVYRQPVRDTLAFQNPKQFVLDSIEDSTADSDVAIVMSHAGLAADKSFINELPGGTILHGAHDHLDVDLVHNGIRYFHGGSWAARIGRLALTRTNDGIHSAYQSFPVSPDTGDRKLASVIEAQKAKHLSAQDKEHIADIPRSMNMHTSILVATDAMRRATQADLAVVNHTTFGASLSAGPMTRYDLDAFVRFGGMLKMARITGQQLSIILAGANQFTAKSLEARTGDYVHVAEVDIDKQKVYSLVVNGWVAQNQESYLGTSDIIFEEIAGLELKAVIADYLSALL